MNIKLEKIRHINKGNVLTFFSIVFEDMDMTINDCKILQGKDGASKWLSFPQRSYEKDGQTKYQHLVYFGKDAKQKIEEQVFYLLDHTPQKKQDNYDDMPF